MLAQVLTRMTQSTGRAVQKRALTSLVRMFISVIIKFIEPSLTRPVW